MLFLTSVSGFVAPNERDPGAMESGETPHAIMTTGSYTPHAPIVITSNANFSALGFPGSGNSTHPYVVENYNVTTPGTCISISNTDAYFIIQNCLLTGGDADGGDAHGIYMYKVTNGIIKRDTVMEKSRGVYLRDSSNNTLVNNTSSGNYWNGVMLETSSNNTVMNNTFSGNSDYGVRIRVFSSRNTITNNIVSKNHGGVILSDFSDYNTIMWNIISMNIGLGLDIWYTPKHNTIVNNTISKNSDDGVVVSAKTPLYTVIVNNTISGNSGDGVECSSSGTQLVNNIISENSKYGVELYTKYLAQPTRGILLYLNTLAFNSEGNAHDDCVGNHWNTTGIGNYWSDYGGTGLYSIPGTGEAIDYHPLRYFETVLPTINHPNDVEYVEGTTGHTITWSPSDAHPSHYLIYRNGTQVASGDWNGGLITIGVNFLHAGIYTYVVVVYDTSDNWISDDVIVTVSDITPPTINHPDDVEYVEGTTGHTITWSPSEAHPSHYVIYRNGSQVAFGDWNGSSIALNVDGLGVGGYNYTLVVYDASSNWCCDTVFVTVVLPTSTSTTTTMTPTTTTTTTATTASTTTTQTGTEPQLTAQTLILVVGVGAAIALVIVLLHFRKKP